VVGELAITEGDSCTRVGPFRLATAGLVVDGEPTFDQWKACGTLLLRAGKAVQWWIGDWLNYGERRYGETYTQAMEATGLGYHTLRNAKWVAARWEMSRRHDNVPFSHHQEVASLPPAQGDAILDRAEREGASQKKVRQWVAEEKSAAAGETVTTCDAPSGCEVVTDLATLVGRGERFGVVYADPPWRYSNQGTRGSTDDHYDTMTVDDIAALPVRELAAERCHLWLWTTNAFLFECPRLFDAWGFVFKSSYVWVKPQMGMGNYLRNSHEFLLLGVRGGLTGAVKNVMSWGEFDRERHSAKPEGIRRDVVERLSPGPRLELFGRKTVAGWTVFGNQVSHSPDLFAEGAV
jgi:N6-adenosine-specific RNA methylase IME4